VSQDEKVVAQQPKNVFDVFETDEKLENNGVVFDCGFGKFKLAYVGNPEFQKAYAEAMKPYAEASARGLLDGNIQLRVLREVYAKTIIKGWSEVYGRDGEEIPYSYENALKLTEELPRLFGMIREWAGNFANYRKIYADTVVGN
jgi:hypothetical protein